MRGEPRLVKSSEVQTVFDVVVMDGETEDSLFAKLKGRWIHIQRRPSQNGHLCVQLTDTEGLRSFRSWYANDKKPKPRKR